MICEHLRPLEEALQARGYTETFRGRPWSANCREWVYFPVVLEVARLQPQLPACVNVHENGDPCSGRELGFYCTEHHDGVMGIHPQAAQEGSRAFTG
ncbi:hypothetical protein [Hymenobacter metallicola]|uniref:Uncharacterized protein n=1 Tax=Hymenobacter metallicola TaxID=2563114 RepID=A0A4Z0PUZ2_9BACT|nr:hypothetical protein [Hymenobacter metallicola]TGE21096.1 hypothetical protein E5K02_24090 [Hymenobacter metallicola]